MSSLTQQHHQKRIFGPRDDFDGNLLHEEAPAEKITKHKQDEQSQIKTEATSGWERL